MPVCEILTGKIVIKVYVWLDKLSQMCAVHTVLFNYVYSGHAHCSAQCGHLHNLLW